MESSLTFGHQLVNRLKFTLLCGSIGHKWVQKILIYAKLQYNRLGPMIKPLSKYHTENKI